MFQDNKVIFTFQGLLGERVDVGQSLIFLVGFLIYMSMSQLMDGLIFAGFLVGSIYLHELGHAWGCQVQGVPVRRIMLHGGGGFCEHARSPSLTEQELIVAMGPIVNLAIWAIASLAAHFIWEGMVTQVQAGIEPSNTMVELHHYIAILAWLNLALAIFNMIPVQPLDGGKLFHLLMLRLLHPTLAHKVTGGVGLVLSVAWIPTAIFFYVSAGWILFFFPSIMAHYRMLRGELV